MHITQFRMTNIGRFKSLEVALWSVDNPNKAKSKAFCQPRKTLLNRFNSGHNFRHTALLRLP